MTRARDNLYWGFRKRERSWHSGISYLEDNNILIKFERAIDEIYISWSAMGDKALEIQDYIEQKISINDMITRPSIDSRDLFHNEKQIGKLSMELIPRAQNEKKFRISNIIRYYCGPYYRDHNFDFFQRLPIKIQQQGWFYIVLIQKS